MKFMINIFLFLDTFIIIVNSQTSKFLLFNKRFTWHGDHNLNYGLNNYSRKIIYYLIDNRVFYECNGYLFTNHQLAVKYYELINSNSKLRLYLKPKGSIKPTKLKSYNRRIKIAEYDFNDILARNPFTQKIWNDIWDGCGYYCYKQYNFQILRKGLISEMNEYRRIHGNSPLKESQDLNILAQKNAFKEVWLINKNITIFKEFNFITETINKNEASHILQYLFNGFIGIYNYNNNYYLKQFNSQTQILWKGTTRVGIGIAEYNDLITIIFIFYPKGNINKKYKVNVPPISNKVVHMFNLFKNHL
ncbi:CAP domain-containing protein [Strongyloides ratti]|uniref:CAP domain-containing protein n=1 Tax=Strongyloides ratti TaxID=34506 RepID=A0A090LLG4_STRRB|nr:CAP domain-containing protein [Strongyloides ratti]CEF70650.1 CAP domain-containing protein [Strongyloides ratti]